MAVLFGPPDYYLSRGSELQCSACRDIELADTLRHKLDVWNASGHIALEESESYMEPSWVAILLGNGDIPAHYAVSADIHPLDQIRMGMKLCREEIMRSAQVVTSHQDFIERHCAVPMPPQREYPVAFCAPRR